MVPFEKSQYKPYSFEQAYYITSLFGFMGFAISHPCRSLGSTQNLTSTAKFSFQISQGLFFLFCTGSCKAKTSFSPDFQPGLILAFNLQFMCLSCA